MIEIFHTILCSTNNCAWQVKVPTAYNCGTGKGHGTKTIFEQIFLIFSEENSEMGITKSKMRELLDSAANSQKREHDKKIAELKKQHDENLKKTQDELEKNMKNLSQLRLIFDEMRSMISYVFQKVNF